ncbi:unnamed protein product [Acidocella sp. C78]|nr:unnamed protein product [Acidocella sp. C78]
MGWTCLGIDPSPMARVGAADLGLDIIDGYFPDALPDAEPDAKPWDVIAATEVIEHVQRPAALIAELRARLAPDGILLLTTPDGAAIDRATPESDLAQLLAPASTWSSRPRRVCAACSNPPASPMSALPTRAHSGRLCRRHPRRVGRG